MNRLLTSKLHKCALSWLEFPFRHSLVVSLHHGSGNRATKDTIIFTEEIFEMLNEVRNNNTESTATTETLYSRLCPNSISFL